MKHTLLILPASLLLVLACGLYLHSSGVAADRFAASDVYFGRRLEPRAGVILHGVGQDDRTFREYSLLMGVQRPMLAMSYVDLTDDLPSFFTDLKRSLDRSPDLIVPQIGLALNRGSADRHYEQTVADGSLDRLNGRLGDLCAGLQQLDRPVFLRIGYEFNGQWNGYSPSAYIAAFRRIATVVHRCAPATAAVWDYAPDASGTDYMLFYPGDDVVDWWAINLFDYRDFTSRATRSFMRDAVIHRFPVMVAEATPRRVPVTSPDAVDIWFRPFLKFLTDHPQVKAFCYIDWDWRGYPQWADWGDARIEDDPTVRTFYLNQIASGRYQSAVSRQATLNLLNLPPVGHAPPVSAK